MVRAGGGLRAGDLDDRIVIETRTDTRDDFGAPIPSWSTFATVWARVTPLSGSERFRAESLDSEVSHEIDLRRLAGVEPTMRVSWDSTLLEINAVLRMGRADMQLLCTELDNG